MLIGTPWLSLDNHEGFWRYFCHPLVWVPGINPSGSGSVKTLELLQCADISFCASAERSPCSVTAAYISHCPPLQLFVQKYKIRHWVSWPFSFLLLNLCWWISSSRWRDIFFFRNNIAQGRKAKPAIFQKHEISLFLYDQMLPSSVENKTNIHQGAAQNSCCIPPPVLAFLAAWLQEQHGHGLWLFLWKVFLGFPNSKGREMRATFTNTDLKLSARKNLTCLLLVQPFMLSGC